MDELMGIVGVPLQLTLTLIKSMDSALTEVNSSQDSTLKAKIICSKKIYVLSAVHNQILFFHYHIAFIAIFTVYI